MKKHIFTLILSLIASILIFILTKMYSAWYFYLLIIPMALAIYIIWIVLFILSMERDAKASIAITKSGFVSLIIAFIILNDSIPVAASTPGLIHETDLYPLLISPNLTPL